MSQFNNVFLPDTPIREVIEAMGSHPGSKFIPGFAVIVDEQHKVIGAVTDGDVRRGLVKGIGINERVNEIANTKPLLVSCKLEKSQKLNIISREARKRNKTAESFGKIILVDEQGRFEDVQWYSDLAKDRVEGKSIAIYGMGFVGLTLAAIMANNQFLVSGIDLNAGVIDNLKQGKLEIYEDGLDSLMETIQQQNPISFTTSFSEIDADIHIIALDTNLASDGSPILDDIELVSKEICLRLKRDDLIIYRTTVPVGTVRQRLVPILESGGLVVGEDFHLAFAPERTVEGNALQELETLPQIVGGFNKSSTKYTAELFKKFTPMVIEVSSLEEAEMVKLVNNTFRDMVFSFSNEISLICEQFNINAHRLIEAANEGYPRNRIPAPSPGVGGQCLSKDPFIFSKPLRKLPFEPLSGKTSRAINEQVKRSLCKKIEGFSLLLEKPIEKCKIFVIGLAFKGEPATSDLRHSIAVEVLQTLGYKDNIYVKDFVVEASKIQAMGYHAIKDIYDGFTDADIALVMNNHYQNNKFNLSKAISAMNTPSVFFDGWNLFNAKEIERSDNVYYSTLGYTTRRYYQVASLKQHNGVSLQGDDIHIDLTGSFDVHNDFEFLDNRKKGRYFWVSGGGSYLINGRYIPIVRRSNKENVNGGTFSVFSGRSDNMTECLNPRLLLRELFEELLIFNSNGILKPQLIGFQKQIDLIYNRLASIFEFDLSERSLLLNEIPLHSRKNVRIELDGHVVNESLSIAFCNERDLNALYLFAVECPDLDDCYALDGEAWRVNGKWHKSKREIFLLDTAENKIRPFAANFQGDWEAVDANLFSDNLRHLINNIQL